MRLTLCLFFLLCCALGVSVDCVTAQPDSMDYTVWVREARVHGLRNFVIHAVDLREGTGRPDTLRSAYYRYSLKPTGSGVLLCGNHAITGEEDSIAIEFDSAGHRICEIDYERGRLSHIERASFDGRGHILKHWVDFDREDWRPPEQYFYDPDGNITRCETTDPRGGVSCRRVFQHKPYEVTEVDSNTIAGRVYASHQITTFDSLGRVRQYRYSSESPELEALHQPIGSYFVYSDTIGRYVCKEYAFEDGEWSTSPWRVIEFDSTRREEIKTVIDSTRESWVTRAIYMPDERIVSMRVSKNEEPVIEHYCQYNPRSVIARKETHDHSARRVSIMEFFYTYSTTGP